MNVNRGAVRGLLLALLLAGPVLAQDDPQDLQALLAQETELATKTRMNHDYVPGMVTVLSGDDLEALGARNVWEALSLLPGVQAVRDHDAAPLLLVRGINFIFNSGNIKILVDSVPFNQEGAGVTDLNSSILLLPIEEVERLEFMRGPGSAIHGDAAYMGLLNIVTRRAERRLFASGMTSEVAAGAQLAWAGQAGRPSFGFSLSGFRNRDVDLHGPAQAEERTGFGRLAFSYGGLSLSLQALSARHDTRPEDLAVGTSEKRLSAEARYRADVTPALHLEGHAGLLLNRDETGPIRAYEGRTIRAGVDASWSAPGRQRLLLTLGFTSAEVLAARLLGPPFFDFHLRDVQRRWWSVGLQDEWPIVPALTFTAGLRLDDFDDIGNEVTTRLALVWNVDDHQIVKAQYSEGFRAPAFFEQYESGAALPGLEAERIAAAELSYILRRGGSVARLTLFRTKLRKMIQPPHVPGGDFSNEAQAETKGVELEWTQQIGRQVRLSANLSWVDPDDTRLTRDVAAASEWMGNLALLADPAPWLRLGARWNHVGRRGGFSGTGTIPGYDSVDLTATTSSLRPGLSLRASLKNVFDDEVVFLSTLPEPFPIVRQRYDGRTFLAEVSFRF